MNAGYVKVSDDIPTVPGHVRADPGLACWAALVHAWDGIEAVLDEQEPPGVADIEPADHNAALTGVRPFG